jgi:glycosyltransferase involved in cell wall biosynthesis
VIAQNPETFAALGSPPNGMILPHSLAVTVDQVTTIDSGADVVFAGRLIPWKAVGLAVNTMAYVSNADAVLHIYGDGPDRRRLERRIRKKGLESRVQIHGLVSRPRLHAAIASARVLLHPALHEEGGMVVAEAMSLGTPVVGLGHAGPAAAVEYWPKEMSRLVPPTTPDATARELAKAVDGFLAEGSDAGLPRRHFKFDGALLEIYRTAFETYRASRTV